MGPAIDLADRIKAAKELVEECKPYLSFATVEPAIARLVDQIARFEARSIRAHLRAKKNFEAYCTENGHRLGVDGADEEVVASFLQQKVTPTSGKSLWLKLDFLRRHLHFPVTMPAKLVRRSPCRVASGLKQGSNPPHHSPRSKQGRGGAPPPPCREASGEEDASSHGGGKQA